MRCAAGAAATASSISTWRPFCIRRAAPGCRRASCYRTAIWWWAARASASILRTARRRSNSRRRCRSASMPGSAKSPRRSASAQPLVLMNYLLARDLKQICAKEGVTGLTAVPPLWFQLSELDWSDGAGASLRYYRQYRRPHAVCPLQRLRGIFPNAKPYLMYGLTEAFRSTYLDPSEIDRRPNSIGKAIPNAEILVVNAEGKPCAAGRGGRVGASRRTGFVGLLE